MSSSTSVHWALVKRILCYLHNTIDMGLCFTTFSTDLFSVFSDADWDGNPNDRQSTGGLSPGVQGNNQQFLVLVGGRIQGNC